MRNNSIIKSNEQQDEEEIDKRMPVEICAKCIIDAADRRARKVLINKLFINFSRSISH